MSQQQILRIRHADDAECVGEMKTRSWLDALPGPVLQC